MAFLKQAPGRHGGMVRINVADMTAIHVNYWHREIQPVIDATPGRADRGWLWPRLFSKLVPLHRGVMSRPITPLCIEVQDDRGDIVPAAMLLLCENYPWLAQKNPRELSTFTWFLTSAPDWALGNLRVPNPPKLGTALIDSALVNSLTTGNQGRMWLHAAPAGGTFLMGWYANTAGMTNHPANLPLPIWWRQNDGRYFSLDAATAQRLLVAQNHLR